MSKGFNDYIVEQLVYGGKKYALGESTTRESTDQLFDDFGRNWLFGTMAKYCLRYKNLARERDILKIATYCYILWLKKGYHVTKYGLRVDVLDTNVQQKEEYFGEFIKEFDEAYNTSFAQVDWYNKKKDELGRYFPMDLAYDKLKNMGKYTEWRQVTSTDLKQVYSFCKMLWEMEYSKVEVHDTDIGGKVVENGTK